MDIFTILAFVFGAVVGFLAAFAFYSGKIKASRDEALSVSKEEIATLKQALVDKEKRTAELANIEAQFKNEAVLRSAAEEKASRIPQLERKNQELIEETQTLNKKISELDTRIQEERKAALEKLEILNDAQTKLSDAFRSLSAEALKSNNQSFLELAKATLEKYQEGAKHDLEGRQKAIDELVKPIKETLGKVDEKVQELEKKRISAYSELSEQVKMLASTQTQLKDETNRLVQALRAPQVRGRWGEMQLRRVVETAGMVNYCDFEEQTSARNEEGKQLRPDLIVNLPGGKKILVDAKAPLLAYLNALEAQNEEAKANFLRDHARQIKTHIDNLSGKKYQDQFGYTPEFVVMFLPGETFFSAALEQDQNLIEYGVEQKVIPASPTTLIALLKAVAYGWRQENIAENANKIAKLGKELYGRVITFSNHLKNVGDGLNKAVSSYDAAIGSLERNLLSSARRFKELEASDQELPELNTVGKTVREIQSSELLSSTEDSEEERQ